MSLERNNIVVVLGALVAVLLQFVIAPAIAISSVQPDVLLAYVLVLAVVRPVEAGVVLPFILGLIYDLTGSGPVGGMAFLFVLVSFAAARAFAVLNNDTLFMPLTIFIIAVFIVEVLYGILFAALELSASPLDVFLYRSLPCTLYDCIVGVVLYPIMVRLLAGGFQNHRLRTPRLR